MKKLGIAVLVASLFAGQQAFAAGFLTAQEFVARASAAGQAEVELGKLAAQKGMAAEIRAFAEKLVRDHGKSSAELAALAKSKGLQVAPPGPAQVTKLAELQQKSGAEFDKAFAEQMIADHDEAVSLFSAAGTLDDKELAAFARQTLPVLTDHQQMAHRLGAAR